MNNKKLQITLIVVFSVLIAVTIGLFIGVFFRPHGEKGVATFNYTRYQNETNYVESVPLTEYSFTTVEQ